MKLAETVWNPVALRNTDVVSGWLSRDEKRQNGRTKIQ